MVLDPSDFTPFLTWLPDALRQWSLVVTCAAAAAIFFGWLFSTFSHGPYRAALSIIRTLTGAVEDLTHTSLRRVAALAWLAVKDSIRRRVVVAFAVFVLILLFAGWYLDTQSVAPAKLYLDFMLTASSYLVWLLVLILSSLSLPTDLKNRTLYTIVTKPVRMSEIVLGRIAGLVILTTFLLTVMGVVSYFFVQRGLAHSHQLRAGDLQPFGAVIDGVPAGLQGKTSLSTQHPHRHKVTVDSTGRGRVEMEQGHTHDFLGNWKDLFAKKSENRTYDFGPPYGMLEARVPVYGKLAFRDRTGRPAEKGINVGDEWMYRSYIEGGCPAAAIWTFGDITEARFPKSQFPNGLPIEMTIEVFRTYKGDINRGILGVLAVRNPKNSLNKPLVVRTFESKEFAVDVENIPHRFQTPDGKTVDLFKDVVSDGRLEVWLKCDEKMQYFGAAQGDLYIRAGDAWFPWNFAKGYFGIWLQSLLVASLGVLFSTFLSGPVAMMATIGVLLGGVFRDFMLRLATGQTYGGGPVESLIRILTQQNMTSDMDAGLRTTVARLLDQAANFVMRLLAAVLPDFGQSNFTGYVAGGFNIPGETLLTFTVRTFAYVLPLFVAAYLCLKNREVAGANG